MEKCIECGFLAVRDQFTGDAREATEQVREEGEYTSPTGQKSIARIFCYRGIREFTEDELRGFQQIVDAIGKEIDCDQFRKWRRGKSPQEHEEMTLVEELRQQARTQREEDLRWQREQEAAIERRHQEAEKRAESRHTRTICFQFLFALLAALVALIAAKLLPFF